MPRNVSKDCLHVVGATHDIPLAMFLCVFSTGRPQVLLRYYINGMLQSLGCLTQEIAEATALLLGDVHVTLALANLEKALTQDTRFLENQIIDTLLSQVGQVLF